MWAFQETAGLDAWTWAELGPDGRTVQSSEKSFPSWYGAVMDATRHGFDHTRHPFQMRHHIEEPGLVDSGVRRPEVRKSKAEAR